jgi:hypothetical protein
MAPMFQDIVSLWMDEGFPDFSVSPGDIVDTGAPENYKLAKMDLGDDSLDPFFFVENSQDVRAILANHHNAKLYIIGHTHSGWGSPQLVFTETLDNHPVTHLNLMSPWYTGRHRGPRISADRTTLEYYPDDPDLLVSFAIHIYRHHAIIRLRDHRTRKWLTQWTAPFHPTFS